MIWRIQRYQRLTQKEISRHQNKWLRALIRHCYDHVPFYHSRFKEANLHPEHIKTIHDLKRIPVMTKDDIRNLPLTQITANNINLDQCWPSYTSGTTGNRLTVYWDKKARLMSTFISNYLHQLECGDKITNRRVGLASFTATPPILIQRLGIFPTRIISPFDEIHTQLHQIKAFNPHTILCTPSSILQVAKEIQQRIQGPELNVSLIFTAGELLDNFTRTFLMETFNANVYNNYGAVEVGGISHDCVHQNMHVNRHSVLVEITKGGDIVAPNEDGEVTVTNFQNYAQPMIRYNLEDIGHLTTDHCPCGSYAPIMELTQGRKIDVIQRSNKNPISVNEICLPLNNIDGIKQFQVVQETIDTVTVKIVPGSRFTKARYEETRRLIQQSIGNSMLLNILIVDQIPLEKSGKHLRFKTLLK